MEGFWCLYWLVFILIAYGIVSVLKIILNAYKLKPSWGFNETSRGNYCWLFHQCIPVIVLSAEIYLGHWVLELANCHKYQISTRPLLLLR